MKIYVVTHFYDNGESYEDYREYIDYTMFSTEAKAYAFYCEKIISDYEGRYSIFEWELDTQTRTLLEKSPWVKCSSMYSCDDWQGEYEPEYDEDYDYTPDPNKDIQEAFRYLNLEDSDDYCRELDIEREWLTHEGTNYQEYQECEKELQERRNAILLEELNTLLKDLC